MTHLSPAAADLLQRRRRVPEELWQGAHQAHQAQGGRPPGDRRQDAQDQSLEAGERLLQLRSQALSVGQKDRPGAEISGATVLQF